MQEQHNVGLYRDDCLCIFRNLSRPNIEKKKKEIIKIFKSFGLSIAVTTNVTSANYLDVINVIFINLIGNRMMNLFISRNIPTNPQSLYDQFHYQ